MNKQRRKQIDEIKNDIRYVIESIKKIKQKLDNTNDEEQDAFDNMPENLQYSRRGENSEEAIDNMNDALDSLDEAIGYLEDIM